MELVKPYVELMGDIDGETILRAVEIAGRNCYKSEARITPESARDFVAMIIARNHVTVLEHEKITARVICDRGVSHEFVRHRVGIVFSQESTRYVDYAGSGIQIIHPQVLTPEQRTRREAHFWEVQELYDAERDEGVSPQIARGVLPNALKTEIVVTANLRAWRTFFSQRAHPAAHPQMREIASMLLGAMQLAVPIVFDDMGA